MVTEQEMKDHVNRVYADNREDLKNSYAEVFDDIMSEGTCTENPFAGILGDDAGE